jgi:hypothetical protein
LQQTKPGCGLVGPPASKGQIKAQNSQKKAGWSTAQAATPFQKGPVRPGKTMALPFGKAGRKMDKLLCPLVVKTNPKAQNQHKIVHGLIFSSKNKTIDNLLYTLHWWDSIENRGSPNSEPLLQNEKVPIGIWARQEKQKQAEKCGALPQKLYWASDASACPKSLALRCACSSVLA